MSEKSGVLDGWWRQAKKVVSPNFNDRPHKIAVDTVIIHNISLPPGEFGGGNVHAFFQNRLDQNAHTYFKTIASLEVSSHLFIERDGSVTQFVGFDKRAWHAGKSCLGTRENCNDFSVGIELEGTDDRAYSEAQYRALVEAIAVLVDSYPRIRRENIVGHSDVAPDRKTDPGSAFDWLYLNQLLENKKIQFCE